MAQIMGQSMRFVIHVPIATGRRIIKDAKTVGMTEAAFASAGLVLGTRSMARSDEMMKQLKPGQVLEFLKALGVSDVVIGAQMELPK